MVRDRGPGFAGEGVVDGGQKAEGATPAFQVVSVVDRSDGGGRLSAAARGGEAEDAETGDPPSPRLWRTGRVSRFETPARGGAHK